MLMIPSPAVVLRCQSAPLSQSAVVHTVLTLHTVLLCIVAVWYCPPQIHTPDSSRYWLADSYESRLAAGQEPQNIDKEFLRLWFRACCDPYKDKVGGGVLLYVAGLC
jgi:hypothetical protein